MINHKLVPIHKQELQLKLFQQLQVKLNARLLQMPLVKLNEYVEQEEKRNPALEFANRIPESQLTKPSEFDAWSIQPRGSVGDKEVIPDDYRREEASKESFKEDFFNEIRMECVGESEEEIAEYIIFNLDDSGLLDLSVKEIAYDLGKSADIISDILKKIQHTEPYGLAASSIAESFIIQLDHLDQDVSLAKRIIEKHYKELTSRKYKLIALKLGVTVEEVHQACDLIASLKSDFSDLLGTEEVVQHAIPDAKIEKKDDKYEVILNDQAFPNIRIDESFIEEAKKNGPITKEMREFFERQKRRARMIIDAIELRRTRTKEVLTEIVNKQISYVEGDEYDLNPLTQKAIADKSEYDNSTISRLVNKKFLLTPRGVLGLKTFFSTPVEHKYKGEVSAAYLKKAIIDIVASENKKNPLADEAILDLLQERGFMIKRRTVAEYRKKLNILSSFKRKTSN